jgi:hypothetical protein
VSGGGRTLNTCDDSTVANYFYEAVEEREKEENTMT